MHMIFSKFQVYRKLRLSPLVIYGIVYHGSDHSTILREEEDWPKTS